MNRVCVFAGSSLGLQAEYGGVARAVALAIVHRGAGLVYGGAHVGLMGVLADAALEAGGSVIGVIPEGLVSREVAHRGLTDLRVVESMHERKALMSELSDAVVALPGGFGTLEELFEMLTWAQLGLHGKPCGLVNAGGYFDSLLDFLDRAAHDGFLASDHRSMLLGDPDPAALLDRMARYRAPRSKRYLDLEET